MRAGEANALQSVDLVESREQRREVARRVVGGLVVIDDLSEELNLDRALRDRLPGLGDNRRRRTHALVAAGIGHDAEGAELVASFDDGHVGLRRIGAPRDTQRK